MTASAGGCVPITNRLFSMVHGRRDPSSARTVTVGGFVLRVVPRLNHPTRVANRDHPCASPFLVLLLLHKSKPPTLTMAQPSRFVALEGHEPIPCPGFDEIKWPDALRTAVAFSLPVEADVTYFRCDREPVPKGFPTLPLSTESFTILRSIAKPSAVGKGRITEMDTAVRRSTELKLNNFNRNGFSVDEFFLDEALKVQLQHLGLAGCFEAKLHKMVLYEPGDFFAAHEDSSHGRRNLVATIIAELPLIDDGDAPSTALRVQINNSGLLLPVFAELPAAHIKVCVMAKGVVHAVEAVDRRRVVITFDLVRREGKPNEACGVFKVESDIPKLMERLLPRVHAGLDVLREAGVLRFGVMCTSRYDGDDEPLIGLDALMKECIDRYGHMAETHDESVVLWDFNGIISMTVFKERTRHGAFDALMCERNEDDGGDTDDDDDGKASGEDDEKEKDAPQKRAKVSKLDWRPNLTSKPGAYRRAACLGDVCFVETPGTRPMMKWSSREDVHLGNEGFNSDEICSYRVIMGTFKPLH